MTTNGTHHDLTVLDRLEKIVAEHADRPAVDGLQRWTYRDLMDRVSELAARLRPVAGPGRIVAIELPHADQALVATLACFGLDMVAMLVDRDMPPIRKALMLDPRARWHGSPRTAQGRL